MRKPVHGTIFATLLIALSAHGAFDVRDFGAKGDGVAKDTVAVQKAIDAAYAAGGGRVVLGVGTYLSGTIWLKDGVDLHLEQGAVLKGSTDPSDYNANDSFPENFWNVGEEWSGGHLVLGYKVKDVLTLDEARQLTASQIVAMTTRAMVNRKGYDFDFERASAMKDYVRTREEIRARKAGNP